MSQSASSSRVADALADDEALGSRDDWWGDPRSEAEQRDDEADTTRRDPNDPAEIIAHKLLRETATVICKSTHQDEPYLDDCDDFDADERKVAEAFACLNGETWGKYAVHTENEAIELTDPEIRLGNHAPESTLVGEFGTERHRKRFNAVTGYVTGGETTGVLIQDRSLADLMVVIEEWLRGVAARRQSGITESEVQECLDMARGLKKNTHQNGFRDVDIMAKVVSKVRR